MVEPYGTFIKPGSSSSFMFPFFLQLMLSTGSIGVPTNALCAKEIIITLKTFRNGLRYSRSLVLRSFILLVC
ncbi:unnamed protein product [Allacma fusca]|uniref:Uncharacterized protein n=1 Tax=Allacma fusca TaxID=39272 RepID=A0A8J2L0Q7_9HEXA|nr:unnamed protein product [Allacma fusca]